MRIQHTLQLIYFHEHALYTEDSCIAIWECYAKQIIRPCAETETETPRESASVSRRVEIVETCRGGGKICSACRSAATRPETETGAGDDSGGGGSPCVEADAETEIEAETGEAGRDGAGRERAVAGTAHVADAGTVSTA